MLAPREGSLGKPYAPLGCVQGTLLVLTKNFPDQLLKSLYGIDV